jgi:hypothetical protein
MLSGRDGRERDFSQGIVRGGDDDDVDVLASNYVAPLA